MKIKVSIITYILISFLLSGCKYEPIYSQKKLNFQILKIEIPNENQINSNIQKRLDHYRNLDSSKKIEVELDSEKIIIVSSKDMSGNPKKFEMQITVNLIVDYNDNLTKKTKFSERFNYNNISNKFDLKKYEENIDENLIDKIYQEILVYLSTI